MISDDNQLSSYDAREETLTAVEMKRRKVDLQRYENVAKTAHNIRESTRLISGCPVRPWEELGISSQRHLIADAEAVAKNPSITEPELRAVYRERLVAWGDTDSPDLKLSDESSKVIEEIVLKNLKLTLNSRRRRAAL